MENIVVDKYTRQWLLNIKLINSSQVFQYKNNLFKLDKNLNEGFLSGLLFVQLISKILESKNIFIFSKKNVIHSKNQKSRLHNWVIVEEILTSIKFNLKSQIKIKIVEGSIECVSCLIKDLSEFFLNPLNIQFL